MSLTGFRAGGVGGGVGNPGNWWGRGAVRGDPLGFGTVWLSLFRDPSVRYGKEGHSLWSRGDRREDRGDVVCRMQRSTRSQLVFGLTLSPL